MRGRGKGRANSIIWSQMRFTVGWDRKGDCRDEYSNLLKKRGIERTGGGGGRRTG